MKKIIQVYFLSTLMLASFCGTGVKASAVSTVEQYGYSEETLLQAMARKGTTDYESTAAALDQEAQAAAASAAVVASSTIEQYGYSESTLLRAMAEKGATDYVTAATILDRETQAAPPASAAPTTEPTVTYVVPTNHLSAAHQVSLQELFASAQGFDGADVHAFNKAWSKENITGVQEIFRAHMGNPGALTFAELRTEILCYKDSAAIRAALDKLEAYSGVGYEDAESGVENTLTILSQNWDLASTKIGLKRKFVFDKSVPAANSRDFIIYSLLENAATAGGCAPGYAGRFVRDQLILLCVQASVSS